MAEENILRKSRFFLIVLLLFFILGLFLLKRFAYLLSPDEISYLSIAQKYLNGNFGQAINGGWSPLFSWLLAPWLIFIVNPLLAAKALGLTIGGLTLGAAYRLFLFFGLDRTVKKILLLCLSPLTLFFSLYLATPDLLFLCLLLFYFNVIFKNENYGERKSQGILCGLLGALIYLSKAYGLPFFLAHFILFNLLYYFTNQAGETRKKILFNFFSGLTVFFILSGGWIGLISFKYHRLTIGTASAYNYAFVGAGSADHPFFQGLIPPPNPTAVSAWEDFSYIKIKPWQPFASPADFVYELKNIFKNMMKAGAILSSFSPLALSVIFAYFLYLLFIVRPFNKTIGQNKSLYLFITFCLYLAGYLLIRFEARYLWLLNLFLLLMAAELLSFFLLYKNIAAKGKKILLGLFLIIFISVPLINFYYLEKAASVSRELNLLSRRLEKEFAVSGKIASSGFWAKTLYLAYYSGWRYYGVVPGSLTSDRLTAELKKYKIDYYFAWGKNQAAALPAVYWEKTGGKINGLKIYSLNK